MKLRLPEHLREDFKGRGSGIILSGDITEFLSNTGRGVLACIGDVVSSYCLKVPRPKVLVVDGKTRRKIGLPLHGTGTIVRVSNEPGTLSHHAWKTLCNTIEWARRGRDYTIVVDGEEDMLALAAFDCSMPGDVVVYGVPGVGAYIRVVDWADKVVASSRILSLQPE